MDTARALLEAVPGLARRFKSNVLLILTDSSEVADAALAIQGLPVVVATSRGHIAEGARDRAKDVIHLKEPLAGSLGALAQIRDLMMGAFLAGSIGPKDKVLVLLWNEDALDGLLFFDAGRDLHITHFEAELADRVALPVAERVMQLASEIAREGREGKPIGTIFIVGDSENVLAHSRQAVINPFQGYAPKDRNLLDDALWETVKEFAQIDGAFIVRADGVIESAGRYLETDQHVPVASGLGGRHLAAASITKLTKAIAFAVSSSGAVRVFKDGKLVMRFGRI
ncbi:MAG TPA: diadenylate cyclase [Candidatus Thermoplasmatota archaeon]|nr:diadenylate cyclase [Candidatus Thermoplasmatota archaeon]